MEIDFHLITSMRANFCYWCSVHRQCLTWRYG